MSDIMRPMPFAHLMNWILSEYRAQGSVFGVSKLVRHAGGKALPIFEEKIESPTAPPPAPTPSWPRTSSRPTPRAAASLRSRPCR